MEAIRQSTRRVLPTSIQSDVWAGRVYGAFIWPLLWHSVGGVSSSGLPTFQSVGKTTVFILPLGWRGASPLWGDRHPDVVARPPLRGERAHRGSVGRQLCVWRSIVEQHHGQHLVGQLQLYRLGVRTHRFPLPMVLIGQHRTGYSLLPPHGHQLGVDIGDYGIVGHSLQHCQCDFSHLYFRSGWWLYHFHDRRVLLRVCLSPKDALFL